MTMKSKSNHLKRYNMPIFIVCKWRDITATGAQLNGQ